MTEYFSQRDHFERSIPFGNTNMEMEEFLTAITEATKIVREEKVASLYEKVGEAEFGAEKPYSTFKKAANRSVDMQTSAQKAHQDIMETIDSKFTLGMDETFNNLNEINGQAKPYKTENLTYTKTYDYPGAGSSQEKYTLSELLSHKTTPIKAARETYNAKLAIVRERMKHKDQLSAEERKAIEGLSEEELVELYYPSMVQDYQRLKGSNWQEENKEWLGYLETGLKWGAAVTVTFFSGGTAGGVAAAYLLADGVYSSVTGKTLISGTRLTKEEQNWAIVESVATIGGFGMGKMAKFLKTKNFTKLATVANAASNSDEAVDFAHVAYDVATKDGDEARSSVLQYAFTKGGGAIAKNLRKARSANSDDLALKNHVDNDNLSIGKNHSNNLEVKTTSDLDLPTVKKQVDTGSAGKTNPDIPISRAVDADLPSVKNAADLNLPTKPAADLSPVGHAEVDLPNAKAHADLNLTNKANLADNATVAGVVGGAKVADLDVPKVDSVVKPEQSTFDRNRVLNNIEASRQAREASNFDQYLKKEKELAEDWATPKHWDDYIVKPETDPRFGERKISQELYDSLRTQTPTQEIRELVNEGISLPMKDPVIPGKEVVRRLEADHIVSMDRITRMDGFEKLTREQQLSLLNYEDNFVGLSKSANTSKGAKTYEEWTMYKKDNIPINPVFRAEMIDREQKLERVLQGMIDNFIKLNKLD